MAEADGGYCHVGGNVKEIRWGCCWIIINNSGSLSEIIFSLSTWLPQAALGPLPADLIRAHGFERIQRYGVAQPYRFARQWFPIWQICRTKQRAWACGLFCVSVGDCDASRYSVIWSRPITPNGWMNVLVVTEWRMRNQEPVTYYSGADGEAPQNSVSGVRVNLILLVFGRSVNTRNSD